MIKPIKKIGEFFWEVFHIFFRHYNFPCKLGLIRVGNPDANSPVFLSGNYTLTVKRVLRNLKGIDCYLLVANSRGSNVWCAAGMNEFSEYDVIDAINVFHLKDVVKHRRIIAPPYAAPGVNIRAVKKETGFNIHWGPTHLDDLPRYIANGFKRTKDMFQVKFGFQDRLEQSLSTSLAYSLTIGIGLFFWPSFFGRVIGLIFIVYIFSFWLYPIFPEERYWRRTLLIAAILLGAQLAFGLWQEWPVSGLVLWEIVLFGIVLLMAMDACGSTPLHKSTIKNWLTKGNYESIFKPVIDPGLCTYCLQCVLVCPRDVLSARRGKKSKSVVAVRIDRCVECLACLKQCPADAIFNRSGKKCKADVKSIPNLHYLVNRDFSHLRSEDRWLNLPTTLHNGIPMVMEGQARQTAEAN